MVLNRIRLWDRLAADRVDVFIANSKTVQNRITKYYRRESTIIYPPVETQNFSVRDLSTQKPEEKYFLAGCRLAPYKRIDIVIEAFKTLGADYKLKIFGSGVDLERLKKIAGAAENIEFLGRVSEEDKTKLFENAQAFINPQEEDFGITVIESMAAGRPVIAYRKGGATETVIEGETGLFFDEETADSLVAAIKKFQTLSFDSQGIRAHAEQFSIVNFKKQITDFIAAHKV
jgi:glycosyltransferase involved in cell wall biosynthesis